MFSANSGAKMASGKEDLEAFFHERKNYRRRVVAGFG
jgi:hypothetical protein